MIALETKKRIEPGRSVRNQRGQALAETGIVITLLLLLIMGVVEFGRAFMVSNMIVHAARDGARAAAVVPVTDRDTDGYITDTSAIVNQVRTSIAGVVGSATASSLTINVSQTGSAASPPPVVTVSVAGDIPFILQWAGFSHFGVDRSVTFRDEGR